MFILENCIKATISNSRYYLPT